MLSRDVSDVASVVFSYDSEYETSRCQQKDIVRVCLPRLSDFVVIFAITEAQLSVQACLTLSLK